MGSGGCDVPLSQPKDRYLDYPFWVVLYVKTNVSRQGIIFYSNFLLTCYHRMFICFSVFYVY